MRKSLVGLAVWELTASYRDRINQIPYQVRDGVPFCYDKKGNLTFARNAVLQDLLVHRLKENAMACA